jgi:DNA-binding response OmpR family regulator
MLPQSCGIWLKSAVRMMANDDGSDRASEAPDRPTVLIVEDEVLNAWHLASVFRSKGFDILGPAASIAAAEALIETRIPDAAILDVNIRGKLVFPVARWLAEQGVALVFATAHAREDAIWPSDLADHPRLQKPFLEDRLVRIVRGLLARPG